MNHPLDSLFAHHSLRLTKPRKHIFDLLREAKHPMSMSEISAASRLVVDRASVYRTIALFEKIGVTKRLAIGWKYKIELGDSFLPHHHHLVCQKCGTVVPVTESALEDFIDTISHRHNFKPTSHHFEVQGLCAHCRGKTTAP